MTEEKNIYGKKNPDGTRTYPDVDLNGASFTLPCTTVNIGGGRFVVVPVNFSDVERLEALRSQAAPRPSFQRGQTPTENKDGE